MDEIIFYCAHCGAKLTAGFDEQGVEFECPRCQTLQLVPVLQEHQEEAKRITTRLTPTAEPDKKAVVTKDMKSSMPTPKKTILLSTKHIDEIARHNAVENEYYEEIGGEGLRMFAVALGTVGFTLCIISLIWAVMSMHKDNVDWWLMLLMFISTFLCGLMGLVIAQLSRFMVKVSERLEDLACEDED